MAVIEVSVAGGNSNENGAYVGGVQPTNADDLLIPAGAGALKVPTGATLACRSIEVAEAWAHELFSEGTGALAIGGAGSKGDNVCCRIPLGKTANITINFVGSSAATEKVLLGGNLLAGAVVAFAGTAGTTYVVEAIINGGSITHTSGGLTVAVNQIWSTFTGSNSNTRTLNIENVVIELTGTGTVWTMSVKSNLTFKATGSTIRITDTSAPVKTFVPGIEQTYGNLKLPGGASVPKVKITQSCTLNNLEFTEGQKLLLEPTKSIVIKLNRVIGAKGTSTEKITIESSTAGTPFTLEGRIIGSDMVFDFCSFKDVKADATSSWYAGSHSTNVSGNTNLKFEAAPAHEHALTATQAQTLTRVTVPGRKLTGTQAQATTRATTVVRALATTQAQAAVRVASPRRSLAASQAQAAVRSGAPTRNLTASQAQAVVRVATLKRSLAATQAQSATRTATPTRVLGAGQAQAASRSASPTRSLSATQTQAPALAGSVTRLIVLTVSQEETLTHAAVILRVLEVGQAQTQTMRQAVPRSLAAGQPQSASEAASPIRTLTAGQPQTALQLHGHSNLIALTATQASSVTLARRPARTLTTTATATGSLARQPVRLSALQGQAASVARSPSRTLAVGITSSASLARAAKRLLVTTEGSSPHLDRAVARTLLLAGTQSVTVVGVLPEATPFVPGKLTSSTEAATMTSSVESHDSSSVEPVLLAESSVD